MVTTEEMMAALDPMEQAQFQMFTNMVSQMPTPVVRMMIQVYVNELEDRGESVADGD